MATPPDFSVGQVLTSATMNQVGLWLVYSSSFTSVTSFSLPNGTFTNDYKNYKLVYNLTVSTDSDFTVRLRKNGTDNNASTYNTTLVGVLSTTGGSNSANNSQNTWAFGEQDAGVGFYSVSFDLYQPFVNANSAATGNIVCVNKAATATIGRAGGWWHGTADTFDSISFISSVASSMTGTVRVYGYTD
jgi:hypothetical protein